MINNNSYQQRTFYNENGFILLKEIINIDLVENHMQNIEFLLKEMLDYLKITYVDKGNANALHDNLRSLHKHSQTSYVSFLRMLPKLNSLFSIYLSPEMLNCSKNLGIQLPFFHTVPVFHIMSQQLVIDDGYFRFEAHQDWPSMQTSLNSITAWTPFVCVDKTNYPLELIPQSHLRGLYKSKVVGPVSQICESQYTNEQFITIEANPGDVLFMSSFLVHRTSNSISEKLRIAASWRYEDAVESSYIERNFPFAQSRCVNMELINKGFPQEQQLRKIFGSR